MAAPSTRNIIPLLPAETVIPPGGATMQVWTGSAWEAKPLNYWTGSAWEQATALKRWSGSDWEDT